MSLFYCHVPLEPVLLPRPCRGLCGRRNGCSLRPLLSCRCCSLVCIVILPSGLRLPLLCCPSHGRSTGGTHTLCYRTGLSSRLTGVHRFSGIVNGRNNPCSNNDCRQCHSNNFANHGHPRTWPGRLLRSGWHIAVSPADRTVGIHCRLNPSGIFIQALNFKFRKDSTGRGHANCEAVNLHAVLLLYLPDGILHLLFAVMNMAPNRANRNTQLFADF